MNCTPQLTGSSKGLNPYPAYKHSGVGWLGEVPEHWEVRRLRTVAEMRVSNVDKHKKEGEIPVRLCNYTDVYKNERITPAMPFMKVTASQDEIERFHLERGDVLITKDSETWDDIGVPALVAGSANDLLCGYHLALLRPSGETLGSYLAWTLQSKAVAYQFHVRANGVTRYGLSLTGIQSVHIPLPSFPEQVFIARFLDHADRRIRRYIRAKKRLIELLEEQRQAIIGQAVTGQIDVQTGQPYPAYKDSGVEWLGEVPEHWRVAALRYQYEHRLGKMLDAKRITGRHLVPYLRNVDVQWDKINVSDLPRMDIQSNEVARYTVQPGDLLVCEGGEVGRCAIWEGEIDRCGFQKALHRLRPRNDQEDNARFLYYTLSVASKRGAFTDGHESTIAHLTGEKLRAHRFAFPPLHEQAAIIEYLDKAISDFNAVIALARRQTDLFQEYRTRLIADVVTGKLDVREAAASLPDQDRSKGQSAKY